MVVLILVLLKQLSQLLLSQHFQGVALALELLLQNFDLVVLLLPQFNNLKPNFILAQFLCFNLFLSFKLLNQVFGVVGLMVDLLIGALLFDLAQVDDVGSDAHADGDGALKIRFHLDELSVVVNSLEGELLLREVLLVLDALSPVNRKFFDLSSVLLIDLICDVFVFLSKVFDKVVFGTLTDALHLLHHLLGLLVVTVHSGGQAVRVKVLSVRRGVNWQLVSYMSLADS